MTKKILITFLAVIFLVLVSKLTFTSAQRYERDMDAIRKDDFTELEEKLDKILSLLPDKENQERSGREINAKLDQLLLNQQKILNELDVVKVRATRK